MAVVLRTRTATPAGWPFSRLAASSVLVLAFAWLGLATFGAGGQANPVAAYDPAAEIVVDVTLIPTGHPPASLVVVRSPAGSRFPPGSVVGSVPNRIVVDQPGTWAFEARFANRRSATVTVMLPARGSVTLAFDVPRASR
jgi:hypothetical protein